MHETQYVPLSELLERIVDNRGKTCPTSDTGIPLIATNCIKDDALYPVFEKLRFVSQETFENWFRDHPKPGDIIFVNKGTPGRVCLTPSPVNFCIAQDMVALRANNQAVYPPYLFAALKSPRVQSSIDSMHVGTMIPHFKKSDFDKLLIPIPDRYTQEWIGDLYLQLSKAIANRQEISKTLEAIARALFQSWFVDFDPVRAKVEGRPTGLPDDISALFPDSFEDTELGEIPSGWQVVSLGSISTISGGKQLEPEKLKNQGLFPVYGANGVMGFSEENTHACFVIIFGRVGAYCGSINWEYNGVWVNNNASSVIPLRHNELVLESMLAIDYSSYRSGSAQPFIPNGALASVPIVVPVEELADYFCQAVHAIRLRQKQNQAVTKTLTSLRDSLLPKLISGELNIPDAEKLLEEAGL